MSRARDLAAFVSNADGDIKFDTDTLFIDSSANRVGFGTTTPATSIHTKSTTANQITLEADSTTIGPNVIFKNTDGNLAKISSAETNTLRFETGPSDTERMRIDSNGNVGIGESSPSKTLVISENDSECVAIIKSSDTGNAGIYLGGQSDEIKAGMILDNSTNDLKFQGHNNAERMRILAGGGLTFNGDTAAANALDDYEQGTFTPTIAGASSAGSPNYSNNYGRYIKIGNMVHWQMHLSVASWSSSPSGAIRIRNMPFNSISSQGETTGSVMHSAINTAGMTLVYFWASNTNEMRMYYLTDNAVWNQQGLTNEAMDFYVTGTYQAA